VAQGHWIGGDNTERTKDTLGRDRSNEVGIKGGRIELSSRNTHLRVPASLLYHHHLPNSHQIYLITLPTPLVAELWSCGSVAKCGPVCEIEVCESVSARLAGG